MVGLVASLSPIANAAQTAQWPARPPLSAACDAWDFHIQDLLDQHRYSQQISDDEFGTALSLFYAAKSSCTLGNEGAAFECTGGYHSGDLRAESCVRCDGCREPSSSRPSWPQP